MKPKSWCMNLRANGVIDKIISECWIARAGESHEWTKRDGLYLPPERSRFSALWDTGASTSAITRRVIDRLNLTPVGTAEIADYRTTWDSESYLVDIGIPCKLVFQRMPVGRGNFAHADVVIGMDIITQGDFAITNVGGRTLMSFRYPPAISIDFVAEENAALIAS